MDKKVKLDQDETDLSTSYEAEEWTSVENLAEEAQRYRQYARETFRKDKRVNIRISSRDLHELQKRAIEEGIPYQTLIASILHKYVSGTLVARAARMAIREDEGES